MKLRTRNRIVTGALLLLVLLVVMGALLNVTPAKAADTVALPARSVPLGMATDHARGRYWVLDSASGRLRLTAIAEDGTVEGDFVSNDSLTNAQALAFAGGKAYIGDVGGARARVTIYQVTEPWPGTDILRAVAYPLAYPDGRHDAAAIMVDARQRVYVITTGTGAGIYRAPQTLGTDAPNALERVADAPAGVTDATVLRDGRFVVRTQTAVIALDGDGFAPVGESAIGVTQRGHALTESIEGGEVVTAAGSGGELTALAVPGPAPATAAPQPGAPPAAPPRTDEASQTRTVDQIGTTASLLAALVVAVLAGVVVVARR